MWMARLEGQHARQTTVSLQLVVLLPAPPRFGLIIVGINPDLGYFFGRRPTIRTHLESYPFSPHPPVL